MALGVGDRFSETILESLPIRQTCERIMGGEILQARGYFLELARISRAALPERVAKNGDDLGDCQHCAAEC